MQLEQHKPFEQEHCISAEHVSFSYQGELVLEDVSFDVRRGDYLGIIGPNGGGKTTLLKIILGLLPPSSGTMRVFGQDVYHLKDERAHIGYVPQRSSQLDVNFPATVEEIVASGRTARIGLFKRATADDRRAIEDALEITEMTKYRDTLISSLSGGQRQRVFIARVLAGEPQIIILDEPTVGVDAPSQERFYDFLADLNRKRGLTVILVSHDIDVIGQEVKTLLSLNRGVVYFGPAEKALTENHFEQLYGRKKNVAHERHSHV